jgi:hypothetical protein
MTSMTTPKSKILDYTLQQKIGVSATLDYGLKKLGCSAYYPKLAHTRTGMFLRMPDPKRER